MKIVSKTKAGFTTETRRHGGAIEIPEQLKKVELRFSNLRASFMRASVPPCLRGELLVQPTAQIRAAVAALALHGKSPAGLR